METQIIQNLFDFWQLIGEQTFSFHQEENYDFTIIKNQNWPSKVFNLKSIKNTTDLEQKILNNEIPNSIAIAESNSLNSILKKSILKHYSTVKAMSLDSNKICNSLIDSEKNIELVDTIEKSEVFKEIAEKSFNYRIDQKTISSLFKLKNINLFLGKYKEVYSSCGIIFQDKNLNSGIHMIGTLPNYRSLGLGKLMTQKLIQEARKNESKNVVLVASQLGEKIYSKLGFETFGSLCSYKLK